MEGRAAKIYSRTNIMTAGHLKSWQLLLEKAVLLCSPKLAMVRSNRIKAQNIISEIQGSLNLSKEPGPELFKALGIIWDGLEDGSPVAVQKAHDAILHFKETIDIISENS